MSWAAASSSSATSSGRADGASLHGMLAVPLACAGVCGQCRGPAVDPPLCGTCQRVTRVLFPSPPNPFPGAGDPTPDAVAVLPVAIATSGSTFSGTLWRYKAPAVQGCDTAASALSRLLGSFLVAHAQCLELQRGGRSDDAVITWIPDRRPGAPLGRLVNATAAELHQVGLPRPQALLSPGTSTGRLTPHRFGGGADAAGRHVVLVDDTWTTGATARCAAHALLLAGASRVTVVPLARHVSMGYAGSAGYLRDRLTAPPWSIIRCAAPHCRSADGSSISATVSKSPVYPGASRR